MLEVIDFYEEFSCLGSGCPFSCCVGWEVALDKQTALNYRREKGLCGIALRLFSVTGEKRGMRLRKIGRFCPFWTRQKLCSFQEKGRLDLMPSVCRLYPRKSIDYGICREVTLELSCIRVAELFLEDPGRRSFVPYDGDVEPSWTIRNEDPSFWESLKADRELLLDILWDGKKALAQKVRLIYEHSYENMPWNKGERAPEIFRDGSGPAFYPVFFLNRMLYYWLARTNLRRNNPFLFRLMKTYEKQFGGQTEKQADLFFQEKTDQMMREVPQMEEHILSYLSYLLQQTYCMAYEDYYLIRPVLSAVAQVQFYLMFLLAEYLSEGALSRKRQAQILANTERSLRHNPAFSEYLFQEIRRRYF